MQKPISLPPNILPDGITMYSRWFKYKNEKILYDKIRSIRIYSQVQKMTINFIPMPTNISTILEIYLTNSNDKIKIKLHFQRFGFKRKKKEEQYRNIIAFCIFLEKKSFTNRFNHYLKTETPDVLFQYLEQGIFKKRFDILKDGRIQKNGKDFASFDEEKYETTRSYKKVHFDKKKGFFGNKVLDISRDEDIFLFIVQNAFKLSIPFYERSE